MLDKDKLILAMYVNIDKMDRGDVPVYMEEIANHVRFDESIIRLIIPVERVESHVECLTPKIVDKKLADEFMTEVKKLEEIIKNFNKDGRK